MNDEKFKSILADAREIVEKAVSEGRPMTEDERNRSQNMVNEAKQGLDDIALGKKIAELEAAAIKSVADEKVESSDDLGSQFVSSDEFKGWMKQVAPNGHVPERAHFADSPTFRINVPLEKKAVVTGASDTLAGAFIQNDNSGLYQPLGYLPITLRDLISVRQTNSDAVDFVRQTTKITTAAAVAEATSAAAPTVVTTAAGEPLVYTSTVTNAPGGGYKPEGSLAFERVTANVETIASWVPVTKRALADAAQLRGIINQELRDALYEVLDQEILTGASAPGFVGIENTSGIQTQAFSTDIMTTARKALTKLAGETPTAFVLSPAVWESLELALFAAAPYLPYQKTLWRVPVVEFRGTMTAKKAYVGNWKKAVLWDRQQATISISDSHADFFIRNLVAILGEMRAAFGVLKPSAFVEWATAS